MAGVFVTTVQAAGLPTYGIDPNAKFKSAGIPVPIISDCRSYESYARRLYADGQYNPAIDSKYVELKYGGETYRCTVPVHRPLEIEELKR
ncbi:MAG TPA: hypothetical protein PLO23_03635 [Alphaproteobacteria bacterium]|nr:hypothetical protein [Alphaproteobacteria bacterium]